MCVPLLHVCMHVCAEVLLSARATPGRSLCVGARVAGKCVLTDHTTFRDTATHARTLTACCSPCPSGANWRVICSVRRARLRQEEGPADLVKRPEGPVARAGARLEARAEARGLLASAMLPTLRFRGSGV